MRSSTSVELKRSMDRSLSPARCPPAEPKPFDGQLFFCAHEIGIHRFIFVGLYIYKMVHSMVSGTQRLLLSSRISFTSLPPAIAQPFACPVVSGTLSRLRRSKTEVASPEKYQVFRVRMQGCCFLSMWKSPNGSAYSMWSTLGAFVAAQLKIDV